MKARTGQVTAPRQHREAKQQPHVAALALLAVVCFMAPIDARAQAWNTRGALDLVRRASDRRQATIDQRGLRDYTARAHGFVLFLAQVGEGLAEPPRMIKADQLVLEVYWRAPGDSKQRIVGRRDRIELPTDINYHRDHLGIVQNNFGDRMRLGDGHEVSDVPHPLAPSALDQYDYAVVDSLMIELPERDVRVFEVLVRPKSPTQAGVVGSLFIDAVDSEVVRFRFGFTKSAYRDATVEDITVALENGLWDGAYWLPRTQEIEIRRRAAWFDIPARGIIRSRWEIDGYLFNQGIPAGVFLGPEIEAAPAVQRDSFQWTNSLADALRDLSASTRRVDLEAVRRELESVVSGRMLSGLTAVSLGAGGLSQILHFNRVEGLAPGVGVVLRPTLPEGEVRLWAGVGLSDERAKGRVLLATSAGPIRFDVSAGRLVEDLGDWPVGSTALNSILAQEAGDDFGDYYLRDFVGASVSLRLGPGRLTGGVAWEDTHSLDVAARPASGSFRPNPTLGSGSYVVTTLGGEIGHPLVPGVTGAWLRADAAWGTGGESDIEYGRLTVRAEAASGFGPTLLVVQGWMGAGSDQMPAHRTFAVGGRGSLVGESFRAWGGRTAAVLRAEWQLRVPIPNLRLGSFASTGSELVVAPFVGSLWSSNDLADLPWRSSDGWRPAVGIAVEALHRLIRAEIGYSLRDSRLRGSIDVSRYFWSIL